jgi:hypothetical protein
MIVRYFDRQDESNPLNGRIVEHDSELLQILDASQNRSPFFAELLGENGHNLLVGIGGATGCVQYSRDDGRPPYLMALGRDQASSGEYLEFLMGNTPTPVPRRYGLPLELVKEIAVHFRQTGVRSPSVSWEEV